MDRISTYKEGIKISDLKENDLVYIMKMKGGYSIIFECSFISYERGVVKAKALKSDRQTSWNDNWLINEVITTRASKCFLWGKDRDDKWERCHWLK